jgi:hypothetical protein
MDNNMSDKEYIPLKSKKFLAYLIADIGWKAIIFYMLMHLQSRLNPAELTLLLTTVITSGVIQIGYILGQQSLDKYLATAVDIFDRDKSNNKDKK